MLASDAEAEAFVDTADLSKHDLSPMIAHSFEFAPKTAQVNMRFPEPLLVAVKAQAAELGISYQRFIRQTLEAALRKAERR
ncbi:CopG family antitoxin [Sandarakinorhabdus sp.]|uniref:CopG family antitoxin n=1 Tax=Sandarakinorhabdus sp. TaxID=1916663 RepID=UPI003F716E97